MQKKYVNLWVLTSFAIVAVMLMFSGSAFAYSKEKPMVLKCGIDNPPMDMKAKTIKRIGDMVTERTDGRIVFKYFYGSSLIKKPQYIDAVARGIADISTGPISFVTGKIPALSIFELYGSYDLSRFLEMQAAVNPLLTKLLAQKGIHHVMLQATGSTVFPHKTKFLKTPADWKGSKMRLAGRWQSTLAKMWGASPIFMPPGDLYLALQRGVIEGYMLIYDIVFGLKLYEVGPFIMDSGFSNNIENVTMNLKKWKKLTPQDQAIFSKVVEDVKPWNLEQTMLHYDRLKKNMEAKGAKIYYLTPEQKSLYLKDAHSLIPEVRKMAGPIGNQFIDILKDFRDK